jgi:hypothetical protein
MNAIAKRHFTLGLLVLSLLCSGCTSGNSRARVKGKVTYRGDPVGNQTLTFFSEGAPGEFSAQHVPLEPDGSFEGEVSGPGKYTLVIEESLAVQENRQPVDKGRKPIPPKYRDRIRSELTWTIESGDNYKEIDLPD